MEKGLETKPLLIKGGIVQLVHSQGTVNAQSAVDAQLMHSQCTVRSRSHACR